MTKIQSLSVVIPAFNEETNIRLGALDKVLLFLLEQKYDWEIIIVDDGSSDHTPKLLDQFSKKHKKISVIHSPHQGKASTVITGVAHALYDIIVFSDLDQATPIIELEKILPYFYEKYDIVIGSRNQQREGAPILRRIMARGFMLLRTVILGMPSISDTQCGFKGFTHKVAKDVFKRMKVYGNTHEVNGSMVTAGFDIELLYIATKLGYKLKEVPVEWHYVETRRVNPIKDSWQGFIDILSIKINALRGLYS